MPRYYITAWRDPAELMKIRAQLYRLGDFKDIDRRQDAVNQIIAWRARKSVLSLALDSTCNLVAATVHDDAGELPTMSLRMMYGTAIARFVTGFCDTTQKAAHKMNMSQLAEDLELPMSVVAIRHEFTHEEIPALSCLRENAKKCLDWLWTWYWAKLDDMVSHVPGDIGRRRDVEKAREELALALNKYVAARIDEVRSKIVQPNERPANVACFHIVRLCKGRIEFLNLLAEALVAPTGRGKGLIPSDKVMGSTMQGAFTVWDKLLYKLSKHQPGFLNILITRMIETIIERSNTIDNEPIKEALYEWVLHILTARPWASLATPVRQKHTENALAQCLASVTSRTTKLAKEVLETQNADFFRDWAPIVKIALEGSPDSVTHGSAALILENAPSKASRAAREVMLETPSQDALYRSQDAHGEDPELRIGWVKYRGLWPRTAIGALPSENEWHKRATISALWEGAGNQAAEWEAMSGDEEGGSLQTMMNGKTRGMRV